MKAKIIISGYHDYIQLCKADGVMEFLKKPIDPRELIAIILAHP